MDGRVRSSSLIHSLTNTVQEVRRVWTPVLYLTLGRT